jgi:hypothetical protein
MRGDTSNLRILRGYDVANIAAGVFRSGAINGA